MRLILPWSLTDRFDTSLYLVEPFLTPFSIKKEQFGDLSGQYFEGVVVNVLA